MFQSLYQFLVELLKTQEGLTLVSSAAVAMIVGLVVIILLAVIVSNLYSANKYIEEQMKRTVFNSDKKLQEAEELRQLEIQRLKTSETKISELDKQIELKESSLKLAEENAKTLQENLLQKDSLIESKEESLKNLTRELDSAKLECSRKEDQLKTMDREIRNGLSEFHFLSELTSGLLQAVLYHTSTTKHLFQTFMFAFDRITTKDGLTYDVPYLTEYQNVLDVAKNLDPSLEQSLDVSLEQYPTISLSKEDDLLGVNKNPSAFRTALGWGGKGASYLAYLAELGLQESDVVKVEWSPIYSVSLVHNRSLSTKLMMTNLRQDSHTFSESFKEHIIMRLLNQTRSANYDAVIYADTPLDDILLISGYGYNEESTMNVLELPKNAHNLVKGFNHNNV